MKQLSLPFANREIVVGDRVRLTEYGRETFRKYFQCSEDRYLSEEELNEVAVVYNISHYSSTYTHQLKFAGSQVAASVKELEYAY